MCVCGPVCECVYVVLCVCECVYVVRVCVDVWFIWVCMGMCVCMWFECVCGCVVHMGLHGYVCVDVWFIWVCIGMCVWVCMVHVCDLCGCGCT